MKAQAVPILLCAAMCVDGVCLAQSLPTTPNPGLTYYYDFDPGNPPPVVDETYDIVVYGGTSAGVTAAVQAARLGRSVALIVFGREVGGMTSGGLVHTDRVDPAVQGGLAREFFDGVGRDSSFDPSRAKTQFLAMLANPGDGLPSVPVYYEQRLDRETGVAMTGDRIDSITMENGSVFRGSMFIDATYEGDLMAAAGVTYTVGRESRAQYGESRAGIAKPVSLGIDPYNTPGNPGSGLIYGVSDEPPGSTGDGDDGLQAYCFRMYLTKNNPQPIQQPAGYDPSEYEILKRRILKGKSNVWKGHFEKDTNNHEVFETNLSTDHVGGNVVDDNGNPVTWADANYAQREQMYQSHVRWNLGMLYWLANDPDLHALATDPNQSQDVRDLVQRIINDMDGLGFGQGEHTETGGFPREVYVREARRMVSDAVMTQAHYAGNIEVDDPVALGNYFADSHHVRRIVIDGTVHAEGNTGGGPESIWGISYDAIVPADGEASNLVVSTTISASSVAWNSLRMEPTFMVLGQSAATAASLALDEGIDVQDLDYATLREQLFADGQVVTAGTDVDSTGVYDEDTWQTNEVDTEAAGNDISLANFRTLVADAYANDRGGVVNFDGVGFATNTGIDVTYGVNASQTMTISVGANNKRGFNEAWRALDPDQTPISYARILKGSKTWDFDFATGVTAVAVTVLPRQGGTVDGVVELADGTRITKATGVGIANDTFFGYTATADNPIISLELDNHGNYNELDDLAFVTDNEALIADAGPDQTVTDEDDDGTETVQLDASASNGGDGTIVSYSWTEDGTEVATGETPFATFAVGTHLLTLTVTNDNGDEATDTVTITVNPASGEPYVLILDNPDAAFTGTWGASAHTSGYYGDDYRYNDSSNTGARATYAPELDHTGRYQVSAWWTAHDNRATNAPFDIVHAGGTDTVTVDQTRAGGQWNALGEFVFEAGTAGSAALRNAGVDGVVIADAVRFELVESVDDVDEDALPDDWEQQIIDDDPDDALESVEDVLPGDDFDGDGRSNFEEYAFCLDPTSGVETNSQQSELVSTGGILTMDVTFHVRSDDPDLDYNLETCPDLRVADWTPGALSCINTVWTSEHPDVNVVSQTQEAPGVWSVTVRMPVNGEAGFFRATAQ